MAFIAYHFNWSLEDILAIEHGDRRRWCEQISRINKAMSPDDHKSGINLDD